MGFYSKRKIEEENAAFCEALADIAHAQTKTLTVEACQEREQEVLQKYRYDSKPDGTGTAL